MRLIDADALIDRIKNPYEQAQVARWVNEQPTIEPEKRTEKRTETHACDCIERQAAIDALHMHLMYRMGTDSNKKRLDDWINGVPSVQSDDAAKRLNDLIFDINPAEICSQIESDNLKQWCEIIQTEMKMAMVQLPCWAERRIDD